MVSGMSLLVKGWLRPLDADSLGSCDWGGCDLESYAERWEPKQGQWLAVCRRHAGKAGLAAAQPGRET